MVIGIDASRANHEQKTGVEWYAFHLIEQMKKIEDGRRKTDVRFVLYSDEPLKGDLAILPPNWSSKVLRWPPRLLPTKSGYAGQAWRLWTQVRLSWEMLVNPPDVLFVPAHVFPIIHPKKTVMTVHDVAAVRFPESFSAFERWYSIFSAKMAVRHLWRIIVPSEFTKRELLELISPPIRGSDRGSGVLDTPEVMQTPPTPPDRGRVYVVPHGYDTRYKKIEDKNEIDCVLKKYGVERPFIMFVGRLEEKKNTTRLIEAFNALKIENSKLKIILVGQPGHGYEKVKQAIDGSPYKHDIITPGWVDGGDIPYLMNAAEAFVFPSLYEGFGLPVLEAFACGTPVVIGWGSSLEEVAGDAAVVVDSMSVESIAGGISQVLTDEATRTACIERGRKRLEQYSWQKAASGTLQVLLSP